jgi:Zn-dependent peptidase ImmA (M78 family)
MKKLPQKFTLMVFGTKVPVKQVKSLAAIHGIVGQYDPKTTSIIIDSDEPEIEKMKTLNHEAIHALLHRLGVTQTMSREMEEVICEGVANLIYENFKVQLI